MGRLDKLGFFNDPLISSEKKDAALQKLLLNKGKKSRAALLKAFQPVIEDTADRFTQKAQINSPLRIRTTTNFMKVADKTGEMLRKHNGNVKVIGLAGYVEKQLWLAMCNWYQGSRGFLTSSSNGVKKYRKH